MKEVDKKGKWIWQCVFCKEESVVPCNENSNEKYAPTCCKGEKQEKVFKEYMGG